MKKYFLMVGLFSFLCGACVSVSELRTPVKIHESIPPNTESVLIRSVLIKPDAIKNVEGFTNASELFSRNLREALALKQPRWKIILPGDGSATQEGDIVVTTELLEIDGGSAGLRFWIGFNAGESQVTARITIQTKTGKDLATSTISQRDMCPTGVCVESNEAVVQRNLRNLAAEVADFILDPVGYEKRRGPSM